MGAAWELHGARMGDESLRVLCHAVAPLPRPSHALAALQSHTHTRPLSPKHPPTCPPTHPHGPLAQTHDLRFIPPPPTPPRSASGGATQKLSLLKLSGGRQLSALSPLWQARWIWRGRRWRCARWRLTWSTMHRCVWSGWGVRRWCLCLCLCFSWGWGQGVLGNQGKRADSQKPQSGS
jgi:hypothetical protein